MSTFDETFDYLSLLGLDPAAVEVQPAEETRERINRRKKEWTAQAINPLYQQQARANLERARQFERILDMPEALEAYLGYHSAAALERRQTQEQTIGEFLALAAGGGRKEITPPQHALLEKICEERSIPLDVLQGALRARLLTVREGDFPAPSVGGAPYRQPALDRALLAQIAGNLRLLDKSSFYELLDLPASASPARIVSTARILYDRWSKTLPKTSTCVAWEKSLQACFTYLKDAEAKTRYDHALRNSRIDEFLSRVDLLLAAGKFSREDFTLLTTIGVHEFGLSNEEVNQSVRWRAATKGLSLSKPIQVHVSTAGLARCDRCGRWVETGLPHCRRCGGSFNSHCRNPACGRPLLPGATHCAHCDLAVSRGVQYRELIRLARLLVQTGEAGSALEACRLAEQILPAPQIEELVARAGKVRHLAASIRRAAADRRWLRTERELADLLTLAPRFAQPGCPRLEDVSRFVAQLRAAVAQIPADLPPADEARTCLELLEKWTDSDELSSRLRRLSETLEAAGQNGLALEIVERLSQLEPLAEEWQVRGVRLGHKLHEDQEKADRIARLQDQLRDAIAADRLYTADRTIAELDGLGEQHVPPAERSSLTARLGGIRIELDALRRATGEGSSTDDLIARHLALLERCRDCRESLAALQSLAPQPPAAPHSVVVTREGTRRTIAWQPSPASLSDTRYLLERSVARPGARTGEGPWQTIYDGPQSTHVDDEVLHAGTIVRYAVRSVRRGNLSVAGSVLQEYSVSSPPVSAEPLLLWQEVLALRVRAVESGMELHWHIPSGVRQVLVERWRGERGKPPEPAELLPTFRGQRMTVDLPEEGPPVHYRVRCIYDGPAGDFVTPGTAVTLVPGEEPRIETGAPSDANAISIREAPDSTAETTSASSAAARGTSGNPLKRMGLWPPVPVSDEL